MWKLLTHDLCHGIGRHLATPDHVFEALHTRVLLFPGHQVSPKANLTCHLGSTTKALAKLLGHLDVVSTKEEGLHVPCTQHPRLSTPRSRVEGLPESVTPVFRRETKCISYVRQDQFSHI
jgi:hypothetical protein